MKKKLPSTLAGEDSAYDAVRRRPPVAPTDTSLPPRYVCVAGAPATRLVTRGTGAGMSRNHQAIASAPTSKEPAGARTGHGEDACAWLSVAAIALNASVIAILLFTAPRRLIKRGAMLQHLREERWKPGP